MTVRAARKHLQYIVDGTPKTWLMGLRAREALSELEDEQPDISVLSFVAFVVLGFYVFEGSDVPAAEILPWALIVARELFVQSLPTLKGLTHGRTRP